MSSSQGKTIDPQEMEEVLPRAESRQRPHATREKELLPPDDDGGGDIMLGVARITEFLRELIDDPTLPEGKVYNWIAKKHIPAGHIGQLKTASKSKLRRHLIGGVDD